jgi:hypothetical protein
MLYCLLKSVLCIIAALPVCIVFTGCTKDEEVTYADTEYSYLTIVGSAFLAGYERALNTWYNDIHIPLLMQYPGLRKSSRYQNSAQGATPAYIAMYYYNTFADLTAMGTSIAFDAANKEIAAHWKNNEYTLTMAISYEKIKSWVKEDYTGDLNAVTIVGAEFTEGKEDTINPWYNDVHIPLIMKYSGVKKAVRFKKLTDGVHTDSLPTYLAIYYYPTAEDQSNQISSGEWAAVLANMQSETADDFMTTSTVAQFNHLKTIAK